MSPRQDNSKRLPPLAGILVGVFLLLVSSGLVGVAVYGAANGEIPKFSRRHPGVHVRRDNSGGFWADVGIWTFTGVLLGAVSVKQIRQEMRK